MYTPAARDGWPSGVPAGLGRSAVRDRRRRRAGGRAVARRWLGVFFHSSMQSRATDVVPAARATTLPASFDASAAATALAPRPEPWSGRERCARPSVGRRRPGRGGENLVFLSGGSVRGLVRRRAGGCGNRGSQDPAPPPQSELLRGTPRPDRQDRTHRPDADLWGATPRPGACRVFRISTSFVASERASSASQLTTRASVRYASRRATASDPAGRPASRDCEVGWPRRR
jgi:hypothetical protein